MKNNQHLFLAAALLLCGVTAAFAQKNNADCSFAEFEDKCTVCSQWEVGSASYAANNCRSMVEICSQLARTGNTVVIDTDDTTALAAQQPTTLAGNTFQLLATFKPLKNSYANLSILVEITDPKGNALWNSRETHAKGFVQNYVFRGTSLQMMHTNPAIEQLNEGERAVFAVPVSLAAKYRGKAVVKARIQSVDLRTRKSYTVQTLVTNVVFK